MRVAVFYGSKDNVWYLFGNFGYTTHFYHNGKSGGAKCLLELVVDWGIKCFITLLLRQCSKRETKFFLLLPVMILLRGGGGGVENIRLLEIEHFNLSIPLCKDKKMIISYLIRHDVLLPFKYLWKKFLYSIKNDGRDYGPDPFESYAHIVWGERGVFNDRVMRNYLDNSFSPHAFPWGINMSMVYCDEVCSMLRNDFVLNKPLQEHNQALKNRIDSIEESVFLHIRRGDYLQSQGLYVTLGTTYYQVALEIIKSKVKHPHIFIFSNDIDWCEKHLAKYIDFSGCDVEFVKGNTEGDAAEEMELMRSCQHAIIANSTFSWWAAYLMKNPNKIVVMSQEYLNDSSQFPVKQFIAPKGWFLVDHVWGNVDVV
ncbi:alpha-1,2-fucosyltransferase [Helicobacter cinaedi]|uniref:Alpha-1,2-fucosyltransferase n=2 Tax=Helicobacter cinaedi TaxID=213 RepID=A0A377JUL5_9HELI|nr:alpha-1,2-fucosyltransferase [Helicobacter cinaedi]STP11596.1 alpha-1,2-fucosyltransferase [Helicobacter cinaedi]